MSISFIANTGIQFYRFEAQIDANTLRRSKFCFIERFDLNRDKFWIDEVIKLPIEEDKWARRSQLEKNGTINKEAVFIDDIKLEGLELLNDAEFYEVGNVNRALNFFQKKWIPLPFFKKNNISDDYFGPTDWVRIYFETIEENKLSFVLMVDTSAANNPDDTVSPFINENPNENIFSLCNNDKLTLGFLDVLNDCQWVEDYISKIFYNPNAQIEKPYLKHVANYIFFIRILRSIEQFPQVTLLSDQAESTDVDLVIDIGNSKTCALLFEHPIDDKFDFNTVKRLEILDLGNPLVKYNESFSTKLVFKETSFGSIHSELNQNKKFQWMSPARIGFEAEQTINDSDVEIAMSREVKTYNSSPKRYLWDNQPSTHEWEFHHNNISLPPKRVYKKGISEQLNADGSLCIGGVFGTKSTFSRKSLMSFVYLEIIAHAIRQINSISFRSTHGRPGHKRKIKRILITCPTAMIKTEQIALRACAEDAMKMANQYQSIINNNAIIETNNNMIEVIPSVIDLRRNIDDLDRRVDWIYDEATSSQLLFMYTMLQHKFSGDAEQLFNLFGKSYIEKPQENKTITIGSLDIGGGTSDLLICEYDYKINLNTSITPKPLFWESFNLAGDDLIKELIQNIILEGKIKQDTDKGCTGVIENHARQLGIDSIAKKLNGFFGKDSNHIGYKGKLMRVNFINQIAMPIITIYMENANSGKTYQMTYDEIFEKNKPSEKLLQYFERHFGFQFQDIVWTISSLKTNEIITSVFYKLVKQVSNIMSKYQCDLIVLSGRPNSFNAIENLFNKFLSITPNRLYNLNHFWIGKWYPFADSNGYIADPKTVVSVGALISLMGGRLKKLGPFYLNNEYLKTKLISTADYMGPLKDNSIKEVVLKPKDQEGVFNVIELPSLIGFKMINAEHYPSRAIYSIKLSSRVTGANNPAEETQLELLKHNIISKMPLQIKISREFESDKELIKIEEVLDNEKNELSKSYFQLSPQTLNDQEGYWLDTGEFLLNIRE
jgi:hypothetical protein